MTAGRADTTFFQAPGHEPESGAEFQANGERNVGSHQPGRAAHGGLERRRGVEQVAANFHPSGLGLQMRATASRSQHDAEPTSPRRRS